MRIPGDPVDLDWPSLWDEDEQRYRVQTRAGQEVRIWTTDAKCSDSLPVRGEYLSNGEWYPAEWRKDGIFLGGVYSKMTDSRSLVAIPRKVKMWVNVYQEAGKYLVGGWVLHVSEESARLAKCHPRHIATVPVEWEE